MNHIVFVASDQTFEKLVERQNIEN